MWWPSASQARSSHSASSCISSHQLQQPLARPYPSTTLATTSPASHQRVAHPASAGTSFHLRDEDPNPFLPLMSSSLSADRRRRPTLLSLTVATVATAPATARSSVSATAVAAVAAAPGAAVDAAPDVAGGAAPRPPPASSLARQLHTT